MNKKYYNTVIQELHTIYGDIHFYIDEAGTPCIKVDDVARNWNLSAEELLSLLSTSEKRRFIPQDDKTIPDLYFVTLPGLYEILRNDDYYTIERNDFLDEAIIMLMSALHDEDNMEIYEACLHNITELQHAQQTIEELQKQLLLVEQFKTIYLSLCDNLKPRSFAEVATMLTNFGFPIGRNQLFTILREKGFLVDTEEEHNMPSEQAKKLQLFEVKRYHYFKKRRNCVKSHTLKVTTIGVLYLLNYFAQHSPKQPA